MSLESLNDEELVEPRKIVKECDQCGAKIYSDDNYENWQCPNSWDPYSGCDGKLVDV